RRYAMQRPNAKADDWPAIARLLQTMESAPCVSVVSVTLTVGEGIVGSQHFSQCLLAGVLTVIIVLLTEGVMSRGSHSRGSNAGGDEKHRAADKEAAADVKKDAPKAGPIPERPPKMANQADSGLIAAAPGSDRLDIPIGTQSPGRSEKEEMESARKETMHNTALTAVTNVATF